MSSGTSALCDTLPLGPPAEDAPAGLASRFVDGYRVIELCFQGGFASVYRAEHVQSGRPVALKVLKKQFRAQRSILRRFEQEAAAIKRIQHPNIVEILCVGEIVEGRPYIAMEWLDGRNLEEELRFRGPLAPAEALAVMEELGAALGAAHALGIVHRDVKAQNVIALPRGAWFQTKLVDFGIAKLVDPFADNSSGMTTAGTILGTPFNMAPEQILGRDVDARTDVYALGVLLYQLVTGQVPFPGETHLEVEELHLNSPPPRPSDRVPALAALDAIVERCLQKERAWRYGSVEELLGALRSAVKTSAPEVRKASRSAAGLYVEARVAGDADDVDDEVFDDVETVMLAAKTAGARRGLAVALESSNAMLITKLIEDGQTEKVCRELFRAASELERTLHDDARKKVRLVLALDVAPVDVQFSGAEALVVGGDLFELIQKAMFHPSETITTSARFREGLSDSPAGDEPMEHADTIQVCLG